MDHRKTNVCYIYLQYKSKEQLLVWTKKANAWYIFEVSKQMTATCLGDLYEKSSRPSVGVGDVPRQRTMMRPIKGISFQVGKSRNLHVANDECRGKYLAYQFELIRRSVSLPTKYSNKLQHNHQGIIPREKYFHSSPPYSYSNDTYEQRVNCKGIILNTSKCCKLY